MTKVKKPEDFIDWFNKQRNLNTAEEVAELYRPLKGEDDVVYDYEVTKQGKYFVIKGGTDELMLTEKSRQQFIKYLDSLSPMDLGIEGQIMFDHAMERDD